MKKKFIFFTMLLLTLMGGVKLNVLNAQETVVEIGEDQNPSHNLYFPLYDYSKYSFTQQIYTKDEIGVDQCSVLGVSFLIGYGNAVHERDVEVYMKNIEFDAFSGNDYKFIDMSESDKVYDGKIELGTPSTWSSITFDTPFQYQGNNVILCVYDKSGSSKSSYHRFYTYATSGRAYYVTGSSSYNPASISSVGPNAKSYNNQIRFTIQTAPVEPTVEITPGSIDLGAVRLGEDIFTEKPFNCNNYAVTVKAQGGATINSITTDNDFFKIAEVFTFGQDEYTFHINYNRNAEAGSKDGNLVVTYDTDKTATISLSADAYSSATEGEAIENPIVVAFTNNAFTHTATGMHDDYILPGEENDGNNGDAVYKFTLENDAVLTASVTGTNPIVAIYNEFGNNEGPSSDNNYEGISNEPAAPSAPTTFGPYTFDNAVLSEENLDADGDGNDDFLLKDLDGVEGWVLESAGVNYTKCLKSYSWKSSPRIYSANNLVVTKQSYDIREGSVLSFDVAYNSLYGSSYPDKVIVELSKDGQTFDNNIVIETVNPGSGTFVKKNVELGAKLLQQGLEYGEYYIVLRHKENNLYDIRVDNLQLTDGSAKSRSVAQTRSTNQIDRVLYPAGTYYLVAAAEGNFTLYLSTSELSAPAAATLTAPANEATEQDNPLLTWTLDKFAEKYQLLLGTTNPPTDVVVDWSDPATSYQTEGLANNTVYYWQVKSKNSVGESLSAVFSFVTPLNKPTNVTASKTNLYPGDETTISWTEAADATSYNVYVGENKVASEVTSPYTLSGLEYNVNPGHNVTVTANHTLGESAKSDAVVVKMTAKSDVTITVKNSAGTPVGGASVRIYDGQDQYGAAIAEQTFTTDDNGQVNEQLLYLNNYYSYKIEVTKVPYATNTSETLSYNSMNNETYSKEITLQLAVPTGFVAESYNVYPEQNIVLSWNEVAEATSYKVYRRGAFSYSTNEYEYTELGETTDLTYSVETPEYNMNGVYYSLEAIYSEGVSKKVTLENPVKVTGYGSFTATVNVEGATIKLEGTDEFGDAQTYEIVADENGNYASDKVLAGSYTATASAFGYNDATATVTVEYNKPASCNFDMTEKPTAPEDLLKDVAVAEEYGAAKVTWTGADNNTQMYNIYRRNVETGDVESVAKNYNDSYGIYDSYTDAAYAGLDDGTYQYGVTTMVDADEVILNEGFEGEVSVPSGWTSIGYWYRDTDDKHSGVYSVYYFAYSNNYTYSLTTKEIDLTDYLSAELEFYYKNTRYGSSYFNNTLRVKVKEIGSSTWNITQITASNVTSYTKATLDLSTYKGKKIQIAFEVYTSQYATTNLDDIVITGTKKTESAPVWSNTIKKGGIVFTNNNGEGDGKWETESNWSNGEVPANDGTAEVTIKAAATISSEVNVKYLAINGGSLTLESTAVLTADELINNDEYAFIIKDGAQLFHNSDNVKASFTMGIVNPEGEGEEVWNENNKTGWQFIASPFTEAAVDDFVPTQGNNYDLYRYAGSADEEWDNHKDNHLDQSWWYFNPGEGYLASYDKLGEATLRGTLNSGVTYSWDNLTYDNSKDLAKFHLVGNPFTFNMEWNKVAQTNMVEGYAVLNDNGSGYIYMTEGTVAVGDAFFVKAKDENPSMSYNAASKATRGEKANSLNVIATGNAGKDNVVINFAGKSEGFNKLQNFNDAIATVYVAEDGKNYGIYNCDADVQEVELSFNANQMGNYTISIEPNGKFQTVTLVDRFTGIETNMLVEDYNFTAMSNVNANRFIVRMVNGQQTTDNSHFVYQSGEELILNIQGDVQIVDVLGRVVYKGEAMNDINRINVSSFNSGAYMVRVMNGNEVKVEKIIL